MTDFALGFYSAITLLMLVTFAVIYAHEGRRMKNLERALSLTAIVCWPLLALGISGAVVFQRLRKRL